MTKYIEEYRNKGTSFPMSVAAGMAVLGLFASSVFSPPPSGKYRRTHNGPGLEGDIANIARDMRRAIGHVKPHDNAA